MPLVRILYLLPLALAGTSLAAQVQPQPQAPAAPSDTPRDCHHHWEWRWRSRSVFGATVQADLPLGDLQTGLDRRTGLGVGIQWTREHGDWNASRTRLEWNTFPEGAPVGATGTRTYAKNYLLSFDHLFKLNQGPVQSYLVAGLGGARWDLEQTTAGARTTLWTTKFVFTAGAGVQFGRRVDFEARYVVGSLSSTFDANVLQASLGWRF